MSADTYRDVMFDVVADMGRRCEASLEAADFLDGIRGCADCAGVLRTHAATISESAFNTAVRTAQTTGASS